MNSVFKKIPTLPEAFGVLIFTYLFALVVSGVFLWLAGTEESFYDTKVFQVIIEIIIFTPFFIYLRIQRYPLKQTLRLRAIPMKIIGTSLVLGVCLTLILTELDKLVALIFPLPEEMEQHIELMIRIENFPDALFIVISTVFIAGLFEEILFRGFIQQAFEHSKLDLTTAIFFSSVAFALFHTPWWYLQITIFGILIGVMAWKSGSILPGAIVHAVNNAFNILLINLESDQFTWLEWKGHISPVLLIVAVVGIFWGFRMLYHYYDTFTQIDDQS